MRDARILVVSGEPHLLAKTSRLLAGAGYELHEAATGAEALQSVRETKPDLVLVETMLPDTDGYRVCRLIKQDTGLAGSSVMLVDRGQEGARGPTSDLAGRGVASGRRDAHGPALDEDEWFVLWPASDGELLAHIEAVLNARRTGGPVRTQAFELQERIKELKCLYGISQLVESAGSSLPEILQGTVELIPPAWQYPEVTCARIVLDGQRHETEGFRETAWKLGCGIRVRGQQAGRAEVCYLEERAEADEGPFLREERDLLNAIAERLGRIAERIHAEQSLKEAEKRYRAVSQLSSDLAYAFRVEPDGTLVREWMTEALSHLTGYSSTELAELGGWAGIIHPEDWPASQRHIERLLAGESDTYVVRVVTKNGDVRWFQDSGRPEWDDAHSRIVRIIGAARDITNQRQAEEALRRYEIIVSTVSDPISYVDRDYRYRAVNETYARYAKRSREEIIGLSVPELLGGEVFEEQVKPHLDRCFSGEEVHYGAWFDVPAEPPRFMEVGYYPVFREDEMVTGAVVVSRDTTDRKQMQEALARERNLLRRITATSPTGIVVFDLQGRIVFANDMVQEISGLTSGDLTQLDYNAPEWRLLGEDGSPLPDDDLPFARVLRTGKPIRDVRMVCELGYGVTPSRRVAISANAAPLLDGSGDMEGVVGTVEDITARVAAEERLRLQTTALTSAANAIVITDCVGAILWANPAFTELTGYPMRELLGQTPRLLKSGVQDREFYREMWATILSGQVWHGELVNRRKDGSLYTEEMSITPVQARGSAITHFVGIKQDITDRKHAEEQAELAAAAAERERLARDLHDAVTQVLFSVAAIAEALPRVWARDAEEGRRGLEQLRTLTRAALAEMRTMLLELRPAALIEHKLSDLLRQLTDGMLGRTQMPVTTTVDGDCDLPPEVRIALYRIAQEALNNTVKYARATKASVNLLCEPGRVLLRISDDGRGFDPSQAQPHQLGLQIMHERAQDIDAELEIRSGPGHGTELFVEWRAVGGNQDGE